MGPIAVGVINEVLQSLKETEVEIKFLKHNLLNSKAEIKKLEDKLEPSTSVI